MVKYLHSSAGAVGLIPGQETKIPGATEQLSLHITATDLQATTDTQCRLNKK